MVEVRHSVLFWQLSPDLLVCVSGVCCAFSSTTSTSKSKTSLPQPTTPAGLRTLCVRELLSLPSGPHSLAFCGESSKCNAEPHHCGLLLPSHGLGFTCLFATTPYIVHTASTMRSWWPPTRALAHDVGLCPVVALGQDDTPTRCCTAGAIARSPATHDGTRRRNSGHCRAPAPASVGATRSGLEVLGPLRCVVAARGAG